MDARTQARYNARARVVKALAHPTRLFIVDALARRDHCVCELQAKIGADMSTVSKHLAVLKAAGIVDDRKQGLQVFYRLRLPCVLNFLRCAESVLEANAREQWAALR